MYIEECDVGGDGERGERGATEVPHDDIATSAEQQTPKKDNKPHTPAKLVFLVTLNHTHTQQHTLQEDSNNSRWQKVKRQ